MPAILVADPVPNLAGMLRDMLGVIPILNVDTWEHLGGGRVRVFARQQASIHHRVAQALEGQPKEVEAGGAGVDDKGAALTPNVGQPGGGHVGDDEATGLMPATRATLERLKSQLAEQISRLSALVVTHRGTQMVAPTLTQYAVPTTFGGKVATWLNGVVDAYQQTAALTTPVQVGGAGGTLAATTELATLVGGYDNPTELSAQLAQTTAATLGLDIQMPWHITPTPVTAVADALVGCSDAWGRIASDVVTLVRPEIAELSEPNPGGHGGSSSMPHKHNPVLSILIRRAEICAPPLAATLHTAAALANDQRSDGAWHAERDALRALACRTVVAGAQCSELIAGLEVHPAQMTKDLGTADVLGEQHVIADPVGKPPSVNYFGSVNPLIAEGLDRAKRIVKEYP